MTAIVIDSNVSLKWALRDEGLLIEADALRRDVQAGVIELIAPSLWIYETIGVLLVATRRGRITLEASREARDDILSVPVRLTDPSATQVYEQAIRYNISGYDAAYLALATELNLPLWTGDHRFYNAVQGRVDFVNWIGDYPSDDRT